MKALNPRLYLVGIAATQIGHHEDGDSNTGSQIAAYQASTELGAPAQGHGWPWCCAFVDWCIKELIAAHPGILSCEDKRPTTASVTGFLEWAQESGQDVLPATSEAEAGDIVIMRFATGFHIGIVSSPGVHAGTCNTIEGNTSGPENGDQRNGGEVAAKLRGFPEVRAFVRLSVKGPKV